MKEKKIMYQGGLRVTLKKNGQELPCDGDCVVVRATIFIPSGKGVETIAPRFQFGGRVNIFGKEDLHHYWGVGVPGGRIKYRDYSAPTWAEAFTAAEAAVNKELTGLFEAMRVRKEALRNAG